MKKSKPTTQSTRLTALEARQAELEKRIVELEHAAVRQMPIPWEPAYPRPAFPAPTPSPFADDARCHVCNNRFKDMGNYVCSHPRCPTRVWCGDTLATTFTCNGTSTAGPYGAPGTISFGNTANPPVSAKTDSTT